MADDIDLDELAVDVEGQSIEKRLLLAQAQQARATAAAMTRMAAAVEALTVEIKKINGPSIDDDPWEAAEQQLTERQQREATTKARNNSRPRPERRGGIAGRQAKGTK